MNIVEKRRLELMGERLKRLRKERGLSQADLASALKVSQGCVSQWECGRRPLSAAAAQEVAHTLGMTYDDFPGATDHRFELAALERAARGCTPETLRLVRRVLEQMKRGERAPKR